MRSRFQRRPHLAAARMAGVSAGVEVNRRRTPNRHPRCARFPRVQAHLFQDGRERGNLNGNARRAGGIHGHSPLWTQRGRAADFKTAAHGRSPTYHGAKLIAAEEKRERDQEALIAKYRKELVDGPVLVFPLRRVTISFSPAQQVPLGARPRQAKGGFHAAAGRQVVSNDPAPAQPAPIRWHRREGVAALPPIAVQ